MKFLILFALTVFTTSSFAAKKLECSFDTISSISKVSWTAFKTPKKVGVGGAFDKVMVTGMSANSLEDFLMGLQFSIHADSVNTNNKARDMKIYKYFFSKMVSGDYIRGFVTAVRKKTAATGELSFQLWLNGEQREEKLEYSFDKNSRTLTANGKIDVLEYSMNGNLKAITKACYAKHKGVTWPDVKIALETKLKPCFSF